MTNQPNPDSTEGIVATIGNKENPSQAVGIKYLPDENAFVTSGIQNFFGEKEIRIPAHMMVVDFQLIGTILSAILEKLSEAQESETTFEYLPSFKVFDKKYSLDDCGKYMELLVEKG